ncbi:MAG: DUF4233 domain-containing protein [Acidothermus sp.]|nr:DUF4233 domain-containing protein [Acidothermus sp.]MCL6537950.1 DUF4233 domain-containing protein [Acidothermus sp.]
MDVDHGARLARARREAHRLAAGVLGMEVVVFWLGIIAAVVMAGIAPAVAIPVGVGLAVGCIIAAAGLRRRWGYLLGTVMQVLAIACGIVVPAMYALGVVFSALWVTAIFLGAKAIREA